MVGDADFERLFDDQFGRCDHLARRLVHDDAVAEELAAEAFARAWARWPKLRKQSPEGWVLRVTANLAIDASRRLRLTPTPPPDPPPVSAADAATLHVALVTALGALPRRQREAIVLRYLADLSEADVATALGVSAGSVKTHVHRGLERLRGTLGPNHDPEVDLALDA